MNEAVQFPARLHVLIPQNGRTALVIRRGPSKRVCVLSWNIETGEVSVSQWLKGRIYERRSDISRDGKYWIYFAINGYWESEAKGSWTAIARAPWLKAVWMFAKGDCWHGGGLFAENGAFWLNDGQGHETLNSSDEIKRSESFPGRDYYGGECLTIYYNRLQRDGWALREFLEINDRHEKTIFEKALPQGWIFRKICHAQLNAPKGKSVYWDEHALISESGNVLECPNWEWAEWLGSDIAFAKKGCLYRIGITTSEELTAESQIHDFNAYEYERIKAPY